MKLFQVKPVSNMRLRKATIRFQLSEFLIDFLEHQLEEIMEVVT
jgi:hypothetical protein